MNRRAMIGLALLVTWTASHSTHAAVPDKGTHSLTQSASADPADVLTRKGMEYLSTGQADSARWAFRKALKHNSKLAAAHCGLGRVELELSERPKKARGHFEKAVKADPTWAEAH